MEEKNNITNNVYFQCISYCQVRKRQNACNPYCIGKRKKLPETFLSILGTKNATKHGNNYMWKYKTTLRKACILSVFYLTYQNAKNACKTLFMEKQNNIAKKSILSVFELVRQTNTKMHVKYPLCENEIKKKNTIFFFLFQVLKCEHVKSTLCGEKNNITKNVYFARFSHCQVPRRHNEWKVYYIGKGNDISRNVSVFLSVFDTKMLKKHRYHLICEYKTTFTENVSFQCF